MNRMSFAFKRFRLRRSGAVAFVAVAAVLGGLLGSGPAIAESNRDGAAGWQPPSYVTTISHPGHAGLYAWGAATAIDGSILIGDYWNYVVRRYSPSGELLQTFGSRGNGPGQNQAPHGIAVDRTTGDIFVADPNVKSSIDRFDASGRFLNSILLSPAPPVTAMYATHIAVGPDGLLYITNSHDIPTTHAQVLVYAPDGQFVRAFGVQGKADGQVGLLRGIAVSSTGEVYLADAGHQRVEVFTSTGVWVRAFGKGYFRGDMRGAAIDEVNGFVYVNDAAGSQVEKFRLDGTWVASLGSEGTGPGQFRDGGRELTVGLDGTLYAPDFGNNRVNVFAADGTFQRIMPATPQQAAPDGLNNPQGITLSADGRSLYVADTFNHRVSRFDALTGAFTATWGFRGSSDPMAMNYPRDVAIDPGTGDLWLLNSRQSQVKHYTADGAFLGSFGHKGHDPGDISVPRGIVAHDGKVYVIDGPIGRVSVFDPNGNFLSMFSCGVYAASMVSGCNGLVFAPSGIMYSTCTKESAVCVFDKSGVLLRKLAAGKLKVPYDLALYKNRLYVTTAKGVDVLTTAGVKLGSFTTTGGAAGHPFASPRGISISATGRMYVLDSLNEHVDVFQIAP